LPIKESEIKPGVVNFRNQAFKLMLIRRLGRKCDLRIEEIISLKTQIVYLFDGLGLPLPATFPHFLALEKSN
jgi:hypothetical protein